MVVRKMPVEGIAVKPGRWIFQERYETDAVEVGRQPGHCDKLGEGWEKVVTDYDFVADTCWLDDLRPANDERHSDSAFVEVALGAAERQAVLGAEVSIVREEDDDGVFVEIELGEFLENRADTVVQGLYHRGLHGITGAVGAGIWFGGVLCNGLWAFFLRGMDGVVWYVAEERFIFVVLNKGKGPFGDLPDMMPVVFVGAFGAGAGLVGCQDIVESLRARVAGASRLIFLVYVEVPFAEVACCVACAL